LVSPLGVVPFDMRPQVACLDVTGFTTLHPTHERTVVVMNHRVFHKVVLLWKSGPTVRDIALEWPLARVDSYVVHQVVFLRKSGPTVGGIALERSFTGMNPLVLSGIVRPHLLAALLEPA
jgi:hypothetical protein